MKLSKESLKKLITETLQEGYMEYRRAEEEAFNNFKNVRSLKNQGKATLDDVVAAHEKYKTVKANRDSYFSPEELEAERDDNERRNRAADAADRAREEEEADTEKRRNAADLATMKSTQLNHAINSAQP